MLISMSVTIAKFTLKSMKNPTPFKPEAQSSFVHIRCTPSQKRRWVSASCKCKSRFSPWVVEALDDKASETGIAAQIAQQIKS